MAAGLVVMALLVSLIHAQGFLLGQKVGMMTRVMFINAIYQKVSFVVCVVTSLLCPFPGYLTYLLSDPLLFPSLVTSSYMYLSSSSLSPSFLLSPFSLPANIPLAASLLSHFLYSLPSLSPLPFHYLCPLSHPTDADTKSDHPG